MFYPPPLQPYYAKHFRLLTLVCVSCLSQGVDQIVLPLKAENMFVPSVYSCPRAGVFRKQLKEKGMKQFSPFKYLKHAIAILTGY